MTKRTHQPLAHLNIGGENRSVSFDALVLPSAARDWQIVFDALAPYPLNQVGGLEDTETCEWAINGILTSLDRRISLFEPRDQTLSYSYCYDGSSAARLRLTARQAMGQGGGQETLKLNLNLDLPDPQWMFLRYFAQRQARAQLGLCQLCGESLGRFDVLRGRWHHGNCSSYRTTPYRAAP